MDDTTRDVLAAADSWLTAMQAITAADEAQPRPKINSSTLTTRRLCLPLLSWHGEMRAGPRQIHEGG
jgi:hypothetical protein